MLPPHLCAHSPSPLCFCSPQIPGFVDLKTAAFVVDGAAISVGACLGTPPLTAYIESASGIREGARTGLAALMVSGARF